MVSPSEDDITPEQKEFERITKIADEDIRNELARTLPYPLNIQATVGNRPSAQINMATFEAELERSNRSMSYPKPGSRPTPAPPVKLPNFKI